MFIGKKDEYGIKYYTFDDIPKIHKLTEFFDHAVKISSFIWKCGLCFLMLYNGSVVIRIAVAVVSLLIHIFFAIGKAAVDSEFTDKWKEY